MKEKENSRDLVYSKVLGLIGTQSLYELNVSQLKKETGLATGTFYYHFPNGIEDILSGLFIKTVKELSTILISKAMKKKTLEESFNSVITEYFSWHSKETSKSHFLWSVSATGFKDFREIMVSEFNDFSSEMYEHLNDKASREGHCLVHPRILDAFLLGATRELVHSWISDGRDPKEFKKIQSNYIDILFDSCVVRKR